MSIEAWVDPGNVANVSIVDFPPPEAGRDPIEFTRGARVYVPKAGASGYQVGDVPPVAWDVYTRVPDASAAPGDARYYVRTITGHEFRNSADTAAGTVGNADSRVFERVAWDQIPIDDLRDIKLRDLEQHAGFVRIQSVRSTTSSNFWISLDDAQRDFIVSANNFLLDRLKDRTIGPDSTVTPLTVTDPTTYWPRDIPLLLIRDSNGQRLIGDLDEAAWGRAMKDIGLYDLARRDAAVNVTNDIDAAHTAGDWTALAAIDVTAAGYGWPDYYQGAVSAGIRVF